MSASKTSEFYIACRAGDLASVERLLIHLSFYDLNRIESNGSTALHAAAFYEHIDIVHRLVEHGAIVRTLKNKYNLTPAQETKNEEIKRLLEPDATYQPRKRFINDDCDNENDNDQIMSIPSTTLFSPVLETSVDSKIESTTTINEEERLEWLDAYDSAHRIAQENHEYMRKWLTKIPLTAVLEAIKNDYIDNPNTELTDKHREEIRSCVESADCDDDPRHLVYAYTLETNFYRQLNKDLAQRGSDFRFEDHDMKKYRDDEPPRGFGQYLFTAVIIHHPSFAPFYHSGTTYRGMNISQSDLDQYVPGARILTRSFLSTSKSVHPVSYYLQFNNPDVVPVLCIYRTIQASRATGLAIAGLSAIPVEDEVLIFPFVAFRVVKVDFASFYFSEQGAATVMFLDQIANESRSWSLCGLEEEKQQQQQDVKHVVADVITTVIPCQELKKEIQCSNDQSIISLYEKHRLSTDRYIQSYLSLHSRLSCLQDLGIDIVNNAAYKGLLTDPSLAFTHKELEWLQSCTNMASFSISLEPATHFLMRIPQDMNDTDLDSDEATKLASADIQEVILHESCFIIFGKPGIGKTTLARWITLKNARSFSQISNDDSSIEINKVRLPIFVHLNEFVQILKLHPNWTLLDCICHSMWFEKDAVNDDDNQQNFARDYICQQQAIIILDGLDEIFDISERNRLIQLIYQFIQVHTIMSSNDNRYDRVSCNQVIITSRWFFDFKNSEIEKIPSYSMRPLSFDNATHFIDRWFGDVTIQSLTQTNTTKDNLTMEVINTDGWYRIAKELVKTLTIHPDLQQLTSNSVLLAAICALVTVQTLANSSAQLNKRVVLYHFTCALMLHRSWKNSKSSAVPTEKESECFLIDIAAYIHQYSCFGCIEEFDVRLKCRSSLKIVSKEKENTRWNRQIVNNFVSRVATNNIGLLVPRDSDLYSFLLPAFQHYFTCLSLVKTSKLDNDDQNSRIDSIVNRILYHITDSLYRESLLLALSYISWQWKPSESELFYEQLLSKDAVRFNRQLPLAAMLLMTALLELHPLPHMKTIYAAFNQFIIASSTREWLTRFPVFTEHFVDSLNNLPPTDAALWMTNYLTNNSDVTSIRAIVHVLLQVVHHTRKIPLFLRSDQETNNFISVLQSQLSIDDDHDEDENNVFAVDRLLVTVSVFDFEMLPSSSMRQYLLESNVQTERIVPSILATIIALYGGLHRFVAVSDEQRLIENVVFSPLHLHRTSTLTNLLIDCLNGNQCSFVNLLNERDCDDISSDTVDLFVAWLCLEGLERPWIYEKFMIWPAFWRALARLRRLTLYLSEYYYTRVDIDYSDDQGTFSSSLFHDAKQIIELYVYSISQCDRDVDTKLDLFPLIQSICSAISRLMFPGGERSLFVSKDAPALGMLNLPLSEKLQELLMSEEYSSKTFPQRLVSLIQIASPPFLPKHLHTDMDDVAEQQQFQHEIRPMMLYRHHRSFPLVILPQQFQPLFTCLIDGLSDEKSNSNQFQLPYICLLGEVARTMSRRREGNARYNLLLAILRLHFEDQQLNNCFTGLVYTTAPPGLRSFFQPFDIYLADQDERPSFNLILEEEKQEDFLLYTILTVECRRAQEVQEKHNEGTVDNLQLYVSAISLAAVIAAIDQRGKDKRRTIANDDEAINTALLIQDPILRLHALTVIWQFEQSTGEQIQRKWIPEIALDLVLSVANNEETPLEYHTILFLIFWSTFSSMIPIDKSKLELGRLLDRLESRANSVTTHIEQAVCKTLDLSFDHEEFPFLRPRIYQFIKDSKWSNESNSVSQVMGLRSPVLIHCMKNVSTSQLKPSTMTLLASMYLMELSIDTNLLSIWFKQKTAIMTKNGNTNDIEKELVLLFDLSDQPETLTFEVAKNIDRLINENTTKTTETFDLLARRLARCSFVQSSALPMIVEWCQYHAHPCFQKYAYCAALLSVQRHPTSTALKICCDLIQSVDDDFRQRACETLKTIYQSSSRLGARGLIDLFQLSLPSQCCRSTLAYEIISKIDLRIDSIETLELLLNLERQRISFLISSTQLNTIELQYGLRMESKDINVSLLQSVYVGLLVPDVRNHFFTHAYEECCKTLAMFDKIQISDQQHQQQLYLVELVLYISRYWRDVAPEKMSTEESLFVDGLIELLAEQYLRSLTILSNVIVKALIVNRPDLPYIPRGMSKIARQHIRKILKKVMEEIDNNNCSLTDDAIAAMITHYYHGDIRFSEDKEEELELLAKLQSYTSFSMIVTDAAACMLVRTQCFLTSFKTNLSDLLQLFNGSYLRLYHALIHLMDDTVTHVTIRTITVELIMKYEDALCPLFVQEFCDMVVKFNIELTLLYSLNHCNHFIIVMTIINKMSSTRFRGLVQQKMDESIFKHSLYCTSRQLDSKRRLTCLQILTRLYGELTDEVNNIFYFAMWENASHRQLARACVRSIQRVVSRSLVEQLFIQLIIDGSRQRRYLAGLLLVQLARCDEISTFEVQQKLTEAIDNRSPMLDNNNVDLMEENGSQITSERLDHALFNLLLQLSFIPNQVSGQILSGSDYRVPEVTNFEVEFSRVVDADSYASCIILPSFSNFEQESITNTD